MADPAPELALSRPFGRPIGRCVVARAQQNRVENLLSLNAITEFEKKILICQISQLRKTQAH